MIAPSLPAPSRPSSRGRFPLIPWFRPVAIALAWLAWLACLLVPPVAHALTGGPDAFGYTFTDSVSGGVAYNFENISATGTTANNVSNAQDATETVPMGFTFSYYGNAYTTCTLATHGYIGFNNFGGVGTPQFTNNPIPNAGGVNEIIAGWWDDLNPLLAGTVYYQTLGTAPNRRFIVQYDGVAQSASASTVTFQFKLFEGTNRIEVHYTSVPSTGSSTMGMENATGTVGLQYFNGSGLPPIGGGPFAIAYVAQVTVTNANDSGGGSLRQAITSVPVGGTINFAAALSGQTISLTSGTLTIAKSLSIDASSLAGGLTVANNGSARVFTVNTGHQVAIDRLTITGGGNGSGGGIHNQATLGLSRCTVHGNNTGAGGWGGGIYNGSSGILTATNCTFANNTAEFGGGLFSDGTTNLNHLTVAGNNAATNAGGIWMNFGTTTVHNSIFSLNTSAGAPDLVQASEATFNQSGTNLIGGSPQLAPLANYGGPTATRPPLANSPAVNAATGASPAEDQRGVARPQGAAADIGSVEGNHNLVIATTANAGDGSLRDAVTFAIPGTTITFAPALNGQTITLGGSELSISRSVSIDATSLSNGLTISGNNASRVIHVATGSEVTLTHLTITGGSTPGGGGGIFNQGSLIVNRCTISGNSVAAGNWGGGILNTGVLTTSGCTIANNRAEYGGGVFSDNVATLFQTTVSANRADTGGGGVWRNGGTVTIQQTIISGNSSPLAPEEANGMIQSGVNLIGGNARLAPLGRYGGAHQTMPPLASSSAINPAGGPTSSPLTTDQRGYARVVGGIVDLGAVEAGPAITVSTLADAGAGSLRQAIADATTPGHRILFAAGLSGGTITLSSQLAVSASAVVTIDGSNLASGISISGNNATRVFNVPGGANLHVAGLTVTGGRSTGGGPSGEGGAFLNSGTLTVNGCTLTGNTSQGNGGAIGNFGTLRVHGSTVTANTATLTGGAIFEFFGNFVLSDSTIAGNTASGSGGGLALNASTATLRNNIVAANSAATNADIHKVSGGTLTPAGANLIGDNSSVATEFPAGTLVGTAGSPKAPLLRVLASRGGPTPTLALRPGSPAIDAASILAGAPATDQRTRARDADGDGNGSQLPDLGAYEVGTTMVTSTADSGAGTLRSAIEANAGHEWITFDPGVFTGTPAVDVILSSPLALVDQDLHVIATNLAGGVTLNGSGATRLIQVQSGSTLEIDRVAIVNGFTGTNQDGAAIVNAGTVTMRQCTLARNQAGRYGGAISNVGSLTLTNCTITDNRAAADGGGAIDIGNGSVNLTNCTVFGNASVEGGGIWTLGGTLTLANSIVAGNRAITGSDIRGPVSAGSTGGNLIGDGSNMSGLVNGVNGNLVGTGSLPIDPRLAPLARYGGALETHSLLVGSPAINAGLSGAGIPANDQRGFARVGQPDIGALEAGPALIVTNTNNSGSGSLRQQIASGTTAGTRILFNLPSNSTIVLTSGELLVDGSRTIFIDASTLVNPSGAPTTEPDPLRPGSTIVPRGVTVSGGNASRVFQISGGSTLGLQRLELTGGSSTSNGGGVVNHGTLAMIDSTIRNSSTTYRGGGLSNFNHAALIRCTVHGNHSNDIGAGIENVNFLSLDRCTIAGNDTPSVGGGIFNFNRMSLRHSTISANAAVSGGGIVTQDSVIEMENMLVAGNGGDATATDLGGGANTFINRGGNLIGYHGPYSAQFPPGLPNGNGDRVGTAAAPIDAKLGALALNGGPTRTMLPIPGSPAIDTADATGFVAFTDQRGFSRALAAGPDIGAVETAAGNFSPDGLTLYAEVPPALGGPADMAFQISTDSEFFPTAATLAGTGTVGAANGAALSSQFSYPSDIAEDASGDRFVADSGNNRIRMLGTDGQVTTIAGTGSFGHVDGVGVQARFAFPAGIAVGPDGHVYVSDTLNHRIRKLTRPEVPGLPWVVSTIAGDGSAGFLDGIGTAARLNHPHALAIDRAGNLYVADTNNHRIRKITPDGVVSTYAGTGTAGTTEGNRMIAKFSSPFGVAIDVTGIAVGQPGGVLFIADSGNHRIRRIDTSDDVTTIAGGTLGFLNGNGTSARFNSPSGVAVDAGGNVVVADRANHAIRKVAKPANLLDPWVTSTLAGTGVAGFVDGRTTSTGARFNIPTGVHVAANGKVLVADHYNHRLRIISEPLVIAATLTGTVRTGSQFMANVSASALGLVPETTYYFRWLAADGSTHPIGESFTLLPIPTVATTEATDVTRFSAVMNGLVDPNGHATTVTFDYSTDPDLLGPLMVATAVNDLTDPRGMAVDAAGNTYVAVRSANLIVRVTPAGVVTVFAGSGATGSANGTGTAAEFDHPVDVAIDASGNLYVAEELGQRIRKITPARVVTTIAGSGVAGFADDSTATAGKFLFPSGVAVTPDGGTIYVADRGNHRIRVIDGDGLATLAGDGIAGFADGPSAAARFQSPTGVAVDVSGNVFVADRDNHRIRVVNASDEVITFAGSGTAGFADDIGPAAAFSSPTDLAFDGSGLLHVCDRDNHRLRTIDPTGAVTTRAGSGIDGVLDSPGSAELWPATSTGFSGPQHVAIHPTVENMLVTESGSPRLRRITRGSPLSVTLPGSYSSNDDLELGTALPKTLVAGATYHFRVRGTNPQGTAFGKILSFTTSTEPQIEVSQPGISTLSHGQPEMVNFGITPLGAPVTRQFTITNSGGWLLTIHSINVPVGYVVGGVISDVIPGESLTFEVTLLATTGGNFSGNLEIESDASGQESFIFPLTGIVRDPPTVTTLAATDVTGTSATFNATVNPEDSSTTVWFEYGTDADFDGVIVSTVAGGITGYAEGTGTAASFNLPRGIATDEAGNLYVADTNNHRIRMIAPDGATSTIAGTGTAGFADGPAGTAQFSSPAGLVRGSDGTLFVADSDNHRIRAISPVGEVTTYSGLGEAGFTDGVAFAARFNHPQGLTMDASGILYVADRDNHRVRRVAINGDVTTLAGTGVAGSVNGSSDIATLNGPLGLVSTATGALYLTESAYHSIRRIDPDGTVTLVAGSAILSGFADATDTAARFASPTGLAIDEAGNLFIADRGNHSIRQMTAAGVVTTVAGSGTAGASNGPGETAQFNQPYALARGPDGELATAEAGVSTIRRLTPTRVLVEAASGLTGTGDIPVSVSIIGLTPGLTYYFRAIATNDGGTTIGNTLSTGGSPFLAWQVAEFGPDAGNPLIAGENANPSGDGIPNLIKYALGLDPHVPTTTGLPILEVTGSQITLTYTEVLGATDIDYVVEWSTDLIDWSDAGVTDEVITPGTLTRVVKASIARGEDTRKFVRLNVTLQQP